jgi:beta-lactamase superfamily II metal-dependent hydrolase
MDVLTLYVAQGALAAVRAGDEAIIVDAHMPECDDVTPEQIEGTLDSYLEKMNVRGLILTGLDKDHACPAGVDSILTRYLPDWIMYPKCFKDTDTASEVFDIIAREERRRAKTTRPLLRKSVRVDHVESRILSGLTRYFSFELFSPHIEDMDSSNNSSIVLKVTGLDQTGFRYLITGDTETERWKRINEIFGASLDSDVLAASHHGSRTGVNVQSLYHISPNTVLISAGVDNKYEHPDGAAIAAYQRIAKHVFCTSAEGGMCLLTRRSGEDFNTHLVRHADPEPANA